MADSAPSLGGKPSGAQTQAGSRYGTGVDTDTHVAGSYRIFGQNTPLKKGKGGKDVVTNRSVEETIDAFAEAAKTNPQLLANIKLAMYQAGVFYPKNYTGWASSGLNPQDIAAFKNVVLGAVRSKQSVDTYLSNLAQMGTALGLTQGSTVEPFHARLTNTTDITAVAKAMAPDVIGRELSETDLSKIVQGFHSLETKSQQADYNAQTTEAAPDLQAYVQEQIRAQAPVDATAMDRRTAADTFFKIISQDSQQTQAGF